MECSLPYEVHEALVDVCGSIWYWKRPMFAFFARCGIPPRCYEPYRDSSKTSIVRDMLDELDEMGDEGYRLKRQLLSALCKLRGLPHRDVPAPEQALASLEHLQKLAVAHGIDTDPEGERLREEKAAAMAARARAEALSGKLDSLRTEYLGLLHKSESPQARGYRLESLLEKLFVVFDIHYRPAYKTGSEQIDGSFELDSHTYLVEAKWLAGPAGQSDLLVLHGKTEGKLDGTRGLFISVTGFRPEVVADFARNRSCRLVLMDGQDLQLILDERITLLDALRLKVRKASEEGIIFVSLCDHI